MLENSEKVFDDEYVSSLIQVEIHTQFAAKYCNTEEAQLSDEIPMSDCYDKENTGDPVQESGQAGRDTLKNVMHRHYYTIHCQDMEI